MALLRCGKPVNLFRYTRSRAPFGPLFKPPVAALCGRVVHILTISST
jgi:hypothetical protein